MMIDWIKMIMIVMVKRRERDHVSLIRGLQMKQSSLIALVIIIMIS